MKEREQRESGQKVRTGNPFSQDAREIMKAPGKENKSEVNTNEK